MQRSIAAGLEWIDHRVVLLAMAVSVALFALALVTPTPARAHHTTVSGVVTCDASTGTYTVDWSALNSESDKSIVTIVATLSGAATGNVTMSTPVAPSGTSTGSSTHAGTTLGTLTLSVDATWENGRNSVDSGSVDLADDCLPPPEEFSVTISKNVVVQPGAAGPPSGAEFEFDLDCIGLDETFSLADGDTETFGPFTAPITCSLDETVTHGADFVSGEFSGVPISTDRSFTVTNTYEGDIPPPPQDVTITITKLVTTDGSATGPAAGTQFEFDLDCIGFDQTFSLADGDTETFGPFTAPITCSLDETVTHGADFVSGEFSGVPISTDRSFTVTNTYEGDIPPPPQDVTITITKLVTTDGSATGPAAGTQFEFDLDCIGFDQTFSLADGDTETFGPFTAPITCSLDETVTHGADFVSGEFSGVPISTDRSFTVTNTYEGDIPPPPQDVTITITKLVTTDGSATGPAAGTQFEFDLDCIGFDQTFSLADGDTETFGPFTAPITCSLDETVTHGADFVSGEFSGVPISTDRSFTVTNTYEGDIPPPPQDVTITITKLVTTDGSATGPAAGTQFEFDLDCIGFDQTFSLADGESQQATFAANTQCSLAETNTQDADSVDGEFSNVLISSNRSFTVTNHYEGVVVLATAISKTLITADPVAVGEQVDFEISVSFVGTTLPDAEFVDIYENAFLEFISLSEGGVALACTVSPNTPDAAHDTVVCPAGELAAATTVTISFRALQSTLPGSTINEANVVYGDPATTIGPAFDDVQIVEVLVLPPLGDGPTAAGRDGLALALLAVLVMLSMYRVLRRGEARDGA